MTSLATAKILFFIAVTVAPLSPNKMIFATSNSDSYRWVHGQKGWDLKTKGLPTTDWTQQGVQIPGEADDNDLQAIAHHTWRDGSALQLSSGNRVEEQGNSVLYIVDPGAPNQKVFTILYPQ